MRIRVVPLPLTAAAAIALASCASTPSRAMIDPSSPITPCSSSPHCVSSKNAAGSARHVDAFKFDASTELAHAALLQVLRSHDDARIESDVMPVVHSTFRTAIGFVDDVTFVFHDDSKLIDVKSRSRIGYYDFGVNRRRVEQLRLQFAAALAKASSPASEGAGQR